MSRFDLNNSTRFIIYPDFYKLFSPMIRNVTFKILLQVFRYNLINILSKHANETGEEGSINGRIECVINFTLISLGRKRSEQRQIAKSFQAERDTCASAISQRRKQRTTRTDVKKRGESAISSALRLQKLFNFDGTVGDIDDTIMAL